MLITGGIGDPCGCTAKKFAHNCYPVWRVLAASFSFLICQSKFCNLKKIFISLAFISSSAALAATSNNSVTVSDIDEFMKINVSENSWIFVESKLIDGMTRVHDFHDMGTPGVQQIDYVVDCTNKKLAMQNFAVLSTVGAKPHVSNNKNFSNLHFYDPIILHDKNIIETICHLRSSGQRNDVD